MCGYHHGKRLKNLHENIWEDNPLFFRNIVNRMHSLLSKYGPEFLDLKLRRLETALDIADFEKKRDSGLNEYDEEIFHSDQEEDALLSDPEELFYSDDENEYLFLSSTNVEIVEIEQDEICLDLEKLEVSNVDQLDPNALEFVPAQNGNPELNIEPDPQVVALEGLIDQKLDELLPRNLFD